MNIAKKSMKVLMATAIGLICVLAAIVGTTAQPQGELVLDFEDGQLPSAAGWTYNSGCFGVNPPESSAFGVTDGILRLDMASPSTTAVLAQYEIQDMVDPTIDLLFEARVRVLLQEPPPPSLAQVFVLGIFVNNYFYILQISEGEVRTFDPEDFTPENSASVDTTVFHTFSIIKLGNENAYKVLVDGVQVFTQNARPSTLGINQIFFGDTTCQSRNGIAEIDFVRFRQTQQTITVSIDIKPGSFPNSIRLGSSGTVPIAILSSQDFDATSVDPTTITLAGAQVNLRGNGTPMASFQDINGDGLLDLVVHVDTEALQLSETDTEAILLGRTVGEVSITGTDLVRIVP